PLPQGNDLNAVKFIDVNTGWAVGDKGTILKTTNSGINWRILNCPVTEDLNDIFIKSSQYIIVIGDYGVILHSSNGGSSWSFELATDYPVLEKIIFTNETEGYICGRKNDYRGGYIFKTTNSGINWFLNFVKPDDEYFNKIFFWDSNTGVTGGSWYTYKTTNAGVNWVRQNYTITGTDMYYKDSLTGLIVGPGYGSYSYIGKTTNGGINFHQVFHISDTLFNSLFFTDNETGYSTGRYGKLLKTSDFGDNWFLMNTVTNETLNSIFFSDNNTGFAVGSTGTLIKTTDGGNDWINGLSGITHNLYHSQFLDQYTGFISGTFGIIKTTDGGSNWSNIWDSTSYSDFFPLIQFDDYNSGWLLHFAGYNPLRLYKTSNSGENWDIINNIIIYNTNISPHSILFIDNNTGFITGTAQELIWPNLPIYGLVLKTTNSGLSWITYGFNNDNMSDIEFVNSSTGYLAGDQNRILKTTNSGENWNYLNTDISNYDYFKISFLNTETGWVLGRNRPNPFDTINVISKTTNGGMSWIHFHIADYLSNLQDIKFLDNNIGWVCGSKGFAYATTNGGINWVRQETSTNRNLYSVNFINPNTGWLIGSKGTILKTISGVIPVGIANYSSAPIKSFSLSQNYPNPFNPSTNLEFGISELGFVSLKVYNSLGMEVADIVNEVLSPGSYNYQFSTLNFQLPSGVYFYRLESGDFTETKRMVLLK
ncbi:MAG: T9SS type A sorting domain-containing protein, partial [Ignavibacteriae bacterium]|nr:T9SS type A sorting domain-containing protein [Ignavibacteriota bacterium]